MASFKEQSTPRPVSGSFARNPSTSRQHSHSISLSASNPSHRVNRRKSNASTSTTAHAAIAAALRDQGDMPIPTHRRSIGSKKPIETQSMTSRPSMHSYFNGSPNMENIQDQEAFEDNSVDEDTPGPHKGTAIKNRNRRASEGGHLDKSEGKKAGSDLRCDTCGKGYKHSSCLTKHMWEHNPAWAFTSKLLISKHQQVQLLEAASVLCNMTTDQVPIPPEMDNIHLEHSEGSSASPEFSGSSEAHDELSSVETTPPPMSEAAYPVPNSKRLSNGSVAFSRSYRSIPSSSFGESAISPYLGPQRLSSVDIRPSTSGTDDGGLAIAAAGLTFSGTPRLRSSLSHNEVPPVPPLPQQYQSFNSKSSETTMTNAYDPLHMRHPAFTHQVSDERHHRDTSREIRKDSIGHDNQRDEEVMFKMEF